MPDMTLEVFEVFMEALIAEMRPKKRLKLLKRILRGANVLADTASLASSPEERDDRRRGGDWWKHRLPSLLG